MGEPSMKAPWNTGAALLLAAPLAWAGGPAAIDAQRLTAADSEPGNWMSTGRTYGEQRYSPLEQVNEQNVGQLGLAWDYGFGLDRVVEATPLVVDGVMYTTSAYSIVHALDARTGKLLWQYDPGVYRGIQGSGCCDAANRGVAVWNGKVYVGVYDGRLEALDARSGQRVWSVDTVLDHARNYTITGAPRIIKGKVVIGNGGSEFGVRGYVTAYDAETGAQAWRFFTVPGDPAQGDETDTIGMIRKTWFGDQYWKQGGGGTVWDSMAYDAELDLLYLGVGNGSFWNYGQRSQGKGDNLFLSSIVAVRPDTGQYVWHYQTTPGDAWDYTATQHIMVATLAIDGKPRKVVMQAPKNGFFYVIDRVTGKLISAKSYVSENTWASSIDLATGRPVLQPGAHNTTTPHLMSPSWLAAHSWHPMAYNPATGLVYFGAQEQGSTYALADSFTFVPHRSNSGQGYGNEPELRARLQQEANAKEKGYLLAWDPRTQSEAWRVPYAHPGSGGVLATAGNLLIQGTIDKTLAIYRADNGKKLWEMNIDQAPVAGPITYMVDGEQYIAINAGWGGSPVYNLGPFQTSTAKLLVFKLGAKGVTLPPPPPPSALPRPPALRASEAQVGEGRALYAETCNRCHGDNAIGGVKDLRFMTPETHAQFNDIVLRGIRADRGMASFADVLTTSEVEAIHAYLIARGNEDYQDMAAKAQ